MLIKGLSVFFIRPLTPLGYANVEEIGYTTEEFISFYRDALKIIEYNKKGVKIVEGHAVIFLQKIIGHFFWQLYGTSFTMWCGDWTDSVLL